MSKGTLTQTAHVLKNDCEHCEELEAQLERTQVAAEMDMASLGARLAKVERENDNLRARLADRAKEVTKRDQEAYLLWIEVHGKDANLKTNAFGPAAQAGLTRARRSGLEQADIEKVIRTHARFPFLVFGRWAATGQARDRKDKISDAFKNEDRWGALLELADALPKAAPPPRSRNRYPEPPSHGYTRPVANVFAALERADCKPFESSTGQGSAHCPIHDDRQKSFRFKEAENGSVLMYCQACASHFTTGEEFCESVRRALEIPITDLYPNRKEVA